MDDDKGLRFFSDGQNWVVARSPGDADELLAKHTGDPVAKGAWVEQPPGRQTRLWVDDEGEPCPEEDGARVASKTNAEWVAIVGRGFFGSTEC